MKTIFNYFKKFFLFLAIPPPRPPKVKAGLIIAGKPICFKTFWLD